MKRTLNEMNKDLISLISAAALNEARLEVYISQHKSNGDDLEKITESFYELLSGVEQMKLYFNDHFGTEGSDQASSFRENIQDLIDQIHININKIHDLAPEGF